MPNQRTEDRHLLNVYLEVRDATDLRRLDIVDRPARALVAARVGATRLIDNVAL